MSGRNATPPSTIAKAEGSACEGVSGTVVGGGRVDASRWGEKNGWEDDVGGIDDDGWVDGDGMVADFDPAQNATRYTSRRPVLSGASRSLLDITIILLV